MIEKRRSWTAEEIEFLHKSQHLARSQLAKSLGRTIGAVSHKMWEIGLVRWRHCTNQLTKIWPKPITAFICGCVAADGHINIPYTGARVVIISTVDKPRAEEVIKVLRNARILATLEKGGKSPISGKQKWVVLLSAQNSQYMTLLGSIICWKMENWLGEYKLTRLKNLMAYKLRKSSTFPGFMLEVMTEKDPMEV